ncbi:hypothetical protein BC938DRAFT_474827 [Jimgerdemannia flammicorona]|uniref:Uncharacterized protein n=1 Tax=Jimgerdemannia flammicorona TaxID=994334 RepID=A0A433Q1F8_9FUNG|nr:hypothetical protein BC938DRAFT_474827 [Jimgerdemannia flammicorona]
MLVASRRCNRCSMSLPRAVGKEQARRRRRGSRRLTYVRRVANNHPRLPSQAGKRSETDGGLEATISRHPGANAYFLTTNKPYNCIPVRCEFHPVFQRLKSWTWVTRMR